MEDAFFAVVFFIAMLVLAIAGVMYLAMDFRHFNEVVKQCNEQGYIQNKTVRISCTVDKK